MPEGRHEVAETYTPWDVTEYLHTVDEIRLYLEMCAKEDPGDGSLIRVALDSLARGRNSDRLASEIGMSVEALHEGLSKDGDPSFVAVMQVINALGMELRIVPARSVVAS